MYIDPPYNTESAASDGNKVADDKENIKAAKFIYRDKFSRNGWLNMMNERLKLARDLLKEDGVIFVSIDDSEQAYLKVLMDEIFDEDNFIGAFIVENNPKGRKNSNFISKTHEYCLVYCKNIKLSYFVNTIPKKSTDMVKDENGDYIQNSGKRVIVGENTLNNLVDETSKDAKWYSVYHNKEQNKIVIKKCEKINKVDENLIKEGYTRYYSYNQDKLVQNTYTAETFEKYFEAGKFSFKNEKIYEKHFNQNMKIKSVLTNQKYQAIINNEKKEFEIDLKTTTAQQQLAKLLGKKIFDFPKNVNFIKNLIKLIDNQNARVLDFFAGSGTTGHAVLELNREDGGNRTYTLVTNNENNIGTDVTYERLYRINNGEGTKGESFEWTEKNEPYKQNLDVFWTKYFNTDIFSEETNNIVILETLEKELNDFGIYNVNDDVQKLLLDLIALKPVKE